MTERVIEYGSKKSYLLKRRRSARKVGSFRREVMDSVLDNMEANPLYRFSSGRSLNKQVLNKDDDTTVSSSVTSFNSLLSGIKEDLDQKDSKQNAHWGSRPNSFNRIKLVDRGQLLAEADKQSSRLLRQKS